MLKDKQERLMMGGQSLVSFFTDPVLRAPTIGCILMCLGASLMGVVVFLRKQSLVGEALSHAAYPGVIIGVVIAGALNISESDEFSLSFFTLLGAFFTALLGLWAIQALEKKLRVTSDAALCFVLSTFFGIGITVASDVQYTYTSLYKQVLAYLYGQAATMTDIHILIYALLAMGILLLIVLLYKELQVMTFDRNYAKSLGVNVHAIDTIVFIFIALAVIIGIRSVGVVLMSAMLIAPAAAARQFTNRLPLLFVLAGCFGMTSGFLGNYFSITITEVMARASPSSRLILPTGPMIVMAASSICIFALLFAPERGILIRLWRAARFRYVCLCENILKAMWREEPNASIRISRLASYQSISMVYLQFILWRMTQNGWISKERERCFRLTADGRHRGAKIVRLHRLWEVYLANYLGVGVERVHCNAEEMEHIITPELENELIFLLADPKQDPHHQPIPPREGMNGL